MNGKTGLLSDSKANQDNLNLLIVEDEESHCEIMEDCLNLASAQPPDIAIAHTVAEACEMLEQNRYDCVLLDHNLPDGHGCDVLKRVEHRLLTTPVIALSTSSDPEVAIAEFRGGCVDFIPKRAAFKGDVLRKKIDEAVAKYFRRTLAAVAVRRGLDAACEESYEEIISASRMDKLMSIWNRSALDDYLTHLHQRTAEAGGGYLLVMCDVDHFKLYNDNYGHAAGDEVLREIADAMKKTLRDLQFLARYGGEEIVLLCEDFAPDVARRIAEGLRDAVWALNIPHKFNADLGRVSISIGAAIHNAGDTHEQERDVFARADEALYESKETGGRNTVTFAPPPGAKKNPNP